MWLEVYGEIPDNLYVLHSCDTPLCINPAHLFLGDQHANMADMMSKNRHPSKKLLEEDKVRIKEAYLFGALQADLALAHGVVRPRVSQIIHE